MDFLDKKLKQLQENQGLRRSRPFNANGFEVSESENPEATNRLINFSSNDYLGLAGDHQLMQDFFAVWKSQDQSNWMSSSSARPLTGTSFAHHRLEQTIANDYQKEAALLFNSGYHANSGILPALTDKHDLILADKLVHASIIDGLRLGSADFKRFAHNDISHLDKLLQKSRHLYKRVWIVTESLFSMDGDFAKLEAIVDLKKQYDALIYLDEAHAVGCYGENGLGLSEQLNVLPEIDILIGVFGKATAGIGAFAVGNTVLIDSMINFSRSWLFSTALPPMNIAWNDYVWRQLSSFKTQRETLKALTTHFRHTLSSMELPVLGESHIVPLLQHGNEQALSTAEFLQTKGFLAMPIRYPTVKKGSERVRFSLTANLPESSIDSLIDAIKQSQSQ